MRLFEVAQSGDMEALTAALQNEGNLEIRNSEGRTPLMVAVKSQSATVEMVRCLLDRGADPNALTIEPEPFNFDPPTLAAMAECGLEPPPPQMALPPKSVLSIAAENSSYDKIALLVAAGADVRFVDANGYSVLLRACFGAFHRSVDDTANIFRLLRQSGASFPAATLYGETVVSVLSNHGHFQLLKVALELGADPDQLGWPPLFHAIAFQKKADVEKLLHKGMDLEVRDHRRRTPFLVAVIAGKLDVAQLLADHGCDTQARDPAGQSALIYSIAHKHEAICRWLIEIGNDVHAIDEFGKFPLEIAVEQDAVECAQILIEAGANVFHVNEYDFGLMKEVTSTEMFELLASRGVNTSELAYSVRRKLCSRNQQDHLTITKPEYSAHRTRKFAAGNPERMNNPFWDDMVRTGLTAFQANAALGTSSLDFEEPTWCFSRYGQSFTRIPGGCQVEIGGEHEDAYDPDFCIYNDVVVHRENGGFDIFGYPRSVFPPTDFHSATYLDHQIIMIGSLGYPEDRRIGHTPVFILDCRNWSIEEMKTSGPSPGWISSHTATLVHNRFIEIRSGKIQKETDLVQNTQTWSLDTRSRTWSRMP